MEMLAADLAAEEKYDQCLLKAQKGQKIAAE